MADSVESKEKEEKMRKDEEIGRGGVQEFHENAAVPPPEICQNGGKTKKVKSREEAECSSEELTQCLSGLSVVN